MEDSKSGLKEHRIGADGARAGGLDGTAGSSISLGGRGVVAASLVGGELALEVANQSLEVVNPTNEGGPVEGLGGGATC